MMLHIPEVLTKAQVAELRAAIDAADWIDGNANLWSTPRCCTDLRNSRSQVGTENMPNA